MKTLAIAFLLLLCTQVSSQEKNGEKEEKTNSSLNVEDILSSEKENVTIISFNQLPGAIKNKLHELNIDPKMIETIKISETKEKTLYAISILQNDKIRTLRIKPNGQMENV